MYASIHGVLESRGYGFRMARLEKECFGTWGVMYDLDRYAVP